MTFGAAFALAKLSILLLYVRIFPVPRFRIACAIVGVLAVFLGATISVLRFVQCTPFQYSWDKTILDGDCMDMRAVFYGGSIPALVLNVVIVGLPMPVVWRLHMKMCQRVRAMLVFGMGGL